jgi:LmbE family N-acetylglucosaminyl deacetylase
MKIKIFLTRPWLLALLAALLGAPAQAQLAETDYDGAAALGLVLRQLGTTKRVLMIAAHPDDETTQVLSSLALGQGAAVAYLSLTRGEGGQNGIGLEMQEGLGLLRSEELLAARRLDGAEQFFTRAIDWGFSKSAEEAFTHWPREELLRDVVAVVRHFRPDVIVSVFTGTPRDGHGQHQAAGIVAREAFDAAGDPARFADLSSAGLRPHAPAHLFQVLRSLEEAPTAQLATGTLDPLLGASYFQIAMASRSRHRSQDMGRPQTPGPQPIQLSRVETRGPDGPGQGLFAGVDTTLFAIEANTHPAGFTAADRLGELLVAYEATADDARRTFNPLHPERTTYFLAELGRTLDRALPLAEARGETGRELRFHLENERAKVSEALRRSANVRFEAVAEEETVVPGQTFSLELRVWNGGRERVELVALHPVLPAGWTAVAEGAMPGEVEPETLTRHRFQVTVPADAEISEPFFLRLPRDGARYRWPEDAGPIGLPFQADEVRASGRLRVQRTDVPIETAAVFRGVDLKRGEFERPLRVVPPVSLTIEPGLAVIPIARAGEPLRLSVRVVGEEPAGIAGRLAIETPAGWRVEPAEADLRFAAAGEERTLEFTLHPPETLQPGPAELSATFRDERGRTFDRGFHLVDYEHIRPRPLFRPATVRIQAVDVEVPTDLRVGYIAGPGDDIPSMLGRIGVRVDLLGPTELAAAALDDFDVIVVGTRAYDGRADLVTHNQRLLEYARRGGTVIVQYNRYEYTVPGLAPYPLEIARPHDRVTDPEAEVRILDPSHPIFTTPNRITAADFDGWVQERGLYFLSRWDERYTPLLEMADPGEAPNRGSLVYAPVGEGRYVYTGLALFRQLPAGVPGAYRLFANLLALGAER